MRKRGILLPVFSLPNEYGIGSFGEEAYRFVDFLAEAKQDYWQVLPLNPTSFGDSPYQSPSANAGNPYFIDLDLLRADGLLTKEECAAQRNPDRTIDYARLYRERYAVLRKAFARFVGSKLYNEFIIDNADWLLPYARFMSNKTKNGGKPWNEWQQIERDENEELFWIFLQYEFSAQWKALKTYANRRAIRIIGDMPIYVAYDSADVWNEPKYFQLDGEGKPTAVAGVPPDAFTQDGQLWGNPLYNWDVHTKEKFKWWINRFGYALGLYDVVRIDHFRGFAGYYSIPYGEKTARNGEWKTAPGSLLFHAVKQRYPDAEIIAEDLGYLDEGVTKLLKETGFPGMKIAQFGFSEPDSPYNPENYIENCVAYTGTHDNETAKEWAEKLPRREKKLFRKCVKKRFWEYDSDALIGSVFQSRAGTVIVPMQDYLRTGKEGRINTPSTVGNNWRWRLSKNYVKSLKKIKSFAKLGGMS